MRLILGFMECFVDRSLNYKHIFSLYMDDHSFFAIGRGLMASRWLKMDNK